MVIIQGFINVIGLIMGNIIMSQGNFIMALFMSISAGTFLYISLGEVLIEQIVTLNKKKVVAMILANLFLALLVIFEKRQEESVEGQWLYIHKLNNDWGIFNQMLSCSVAILFM